MLIETLELTLPLNTGHRRSLDDPCGGLCSGMMLKARLSARARKEDRHKGSQRHPQRNSQAMNGMEDRLSVREGKMMLSLNKVLLMGQVAAEGVKFFRNENNTPEAIWTLVVEEPGAQGTVFKTFIPCVAYAKAAQATVETLQAGQTVFLEGRLKLRSLMTETGETKGRLEVVTWMVQPLGISTSTTTAA
jgi:hypothetical protein